MAYDSRNKRLTLEPIHISDWDETTSPHSTGGHYYDGEIIYQYLEKYNITEEDIREYQNYILYEVVLKTWVETHGEITNGKRKNWRTVRLLIIHLISQKNSLEDW